MIGCIFDKMRPLFSHLRRLSVEYALVLHVKLVDDDVAKVFP